MYNLKEYFFVIFFTQFQIAFILVFFRMVAQVLPANYANPGRLWATFA